MVFVVRRSSVQWYSTVPGRMVETMEYQERGTERELLAILYQEQLFGAPQL